MLYCLMCQDKENAIETRMQNREDHLKYVAETNVVKYAGPLLSEEDTCLLYTSPSPRDKRQSRMPSSA